MKTLFLTFACLALLAGSALAQITDSSPDVGTTPIELDRHHTPHPHPVQPVPEPGTMALASMGLIALGAAARKRRGK